MSTAYAIELDGVGKRYGEGTGATFALRHVSLAVPVGEFLSVTGSSGAGKSTLLNLIAGLDVTTEGRVVVLGQDIATLSDNARSDLRLRGIGFIFQAFNLFPTFTAEENVAWPLGFLGMGWRPALAAAAAMLEEVGVGDGTRHRVPAELSGGEQQRVAIARALVTKPRLILADEPTGNLDSQTGQAILDLLLRLNAQRDFTVVLVTHNLLAAQSGHRTIELRDGKIVREARADPEPSRRRTAVPPG